MQWDNPVAVLPRRRIEARQGGRKFALEERLRQLRQAYVVLRFNFCIPGGEQDGHTRPFLLDGFGQLRPGHVRHGLVGNDQIDGILALENFERLLAGKCLKNGVTKILEHARPCS